MYVSECCCFALVLSTDSTTASSTLPSSMWKIRWSGAFSAATLRRLSLPATVQLPKIDTFHPVSTLFPHFFHTGKQ